MSEIIVEPLRIFVAGPYNPYGEKPHNAIRLAQRNLDEAIKHANIIIDLGHYAFVPHLTHYLHIHYSCGHDRGDFYYDYDNSFLDLWANALFYIAPSPGADNELKRAQGRGYFIFKSISEVPRLK